MRNVSQKCWARGCKSCRIMDTGKSANVIFLFICKHCCSEQGTPDYYFGCTMDKLHKRVNVNRTHFKTNNFEYKKSALALHVVGKHPDHFSENLENFHLCLIISTRPQDLERAEDYFIRNTRAYTIALIK